MLTMLRKPNKRIASLLKRIPGRKYFGVYRFLPFFAFYGAVLEFVMIKWTVGETNFYKVYKRNQARKIALKQIEEEEQILRQSNKSETSDN